VIMCSRHRTRERPWDGLLCTTLLFLPPYTPDLNPIEQPFAKLKALLRAKALRTVDALWKALGSVADCVSPQECKNLIRHAGPAMIRAR
jgi:transposase